VKRASVLYADDDEGQRATFQHVFGDKLSVVTAPTDEALARLEQGSVGVFVTDGRVLAVEGNELLQRVRARHPDVVRLVLTAYGDETKALVAMHEGLIARFVTKPWERAELEEILRWALEIHARGHQDPAIQLRLVQVERLVALGGIAAALLHDLAQPVGVAETNTSRLAELASAAPALAALLERHGDELEKGDAARLRDLAGEMRDITSDMRAGLAHMQSLLDQIRELARTPPSSDAKRCDPVAVVRFVAGACRSVAARARVRLTVECPEELSIVTVTKTELTQVLMNLVSNAIQAVEKRGAGGGVAISASVQTNALLLHLADDGVGIPAALLEKVGTPFFSTRAEGTGLGVAQCRRIVEGCGGTFRVESTEGVGTQVFVRLPWATHPRHR
jgi:signal transduction histidine kinase